MPSPGSLRLALHQSWPYLHSVTTRVYCARPLSPFHIVHPSPPAAEARSKATEAERAESLAHSLGLEVERLRQQLELAQLAAGEMQQELTEGLMRAQQAAQEVERAAGSRGGWFKVWGSERWPEGLGLSSGLQCVCQLWCPRAHPGTVQLWSALPRLPADVGA